MRASVLVVDDDPVFRSLAREVLVARGFVVAAEAATVAEALAAAPRVRPDAALVDLGLPDGDGVALAAALTALPWHPRVVLTSTDADGVGAETVRRSGARAFFPKEDLPDTPLEQLLGGDD